MRVVLEAGEVWLVFNAKGKKAVQVGERCMASFHARGREGTCIFMQVGKCRGLS